MAEISLGFESFEQRQTRIHPAEVILNTDLLASVWQNINTCTSAEVRLGLARSGVSRKDIDHICRAIELRQQRAIKHQRVTLQLLLKILPYPQHLNEISRDRVQWIHGIPVFYFDPTINPHNGRLMDRSFTSQMQDASTPIEIYSNHIIINPQYTLYNSSKTMQKLVLYTHYSQDSKTPNTPYFKFKSMILGHIAQSTDYNIDDLRNTLNEDTLTTYLQKLPYHILLNHIQTWLGVRKNNVETYYQLMAILDGKSIHQATDDLATRVGFVQNGDMHLPEKHDPLYDVAQLEILISQDLRAGGAYQSVEKKDVMIDKLMYFQFNDNKLSGVNGAQLDSIPREETQLKTYLYDFIQSEIPKAIKGGYVHILKQNLLCIHAHLGLDRLLQIYLETLITAIFDDLNIWYGMLSIQYARPESHNPGLNFELLQLIFAESYSLEELAQNLSVRARFATTREMIAESKRLQKNYMWKRRLTRALPKSRN
jgi:hypothetical protein